MKKLVLAGLACAGLIALVPTPAYAHGGQYRGPGDVTPPSPGGGRGTGGPAGPTTGGPAGPSTPGPAGPATPGPTGPATGGPAGPGGGRGPTTGGHGIELTDDLSQWQFWWEFNKDPYIRLKAAIHQGGIQTGGDEFFLGATKSTEASNTMKPSDETILNNILPALKTAISATEQRDIVSSCMIAMAKIGKDHPDFKLSSIFAPRLKSHDLETQETAALAFGIAALPDADNVKMLIELAKDTSIGRSATGSSEINDRIRTFATYGLGLLAHENSDPALKKAIFETLKGMLANDKASSRNLKVGVINAIGLLNIGNTGGSDQDPLLADAVNALTEYYVKDLGAGEQLMQSHCPPAIAKLLGRDNGELAKKTKALFALDLSGKSKLKHTAREIDQSCVLALGVMCQPYEDDKDKSPDADYSKLLLDTFRNHKDPQTKYFAVLALGQIGGKENHDTLIKEFDKAKKMDKPWCAIAMGVYAFEKYDAAEKAGGAADIERAFGETLRAALKDEKSPNPLGGIAIGLGLCRFKEAADDLRSLLLKTREEELAGYLCIGLALMNEKRAIEDINTVVKQSLRKPKLLQQAAVALGKLGDKDVAETLQKMLGDDDRNLAKMSAIASALGFIGDSRTIEPLKKMLFDEQLTDLSRAFAAVALGGVGDKEDLPWNSKIATNMNYRASVETLTGSGTGILDIL